MEGHFGLKKYMFKVMITQVYQNVKILPKTGECLVNMLIIVR